MTPRAFRTLPGRSTVASRGNSLRLLHTMHCVMVMAVTWTDASVGHREGRRSPARGPGARRGTRKVMRHCIPCIALRTRRSRSGSLRSPHPGLRKIDPGSWIRVGRKCASFLPSHTVRSWGEGPWFPQPRASPSLYYTSRLRPRPACPAGERGWKATTETECSSRPRPARPDGE